MVKEARPAADATLFATSCSPLPTLIDTDPGLDDAIAILFALGSPEFDVLGLSTLAGNIGLDTTTRNAGRLLALAGRPDVPLARGAARPLARAHRHAEDVHGPDGIGAVALPEEAVPAGPLPAVPFMAGTLRARPEGGVQVLALGPLTNLAELVAAEPEAARRIGRVIAMGGAVRERGNVSPRAEFNFAADPEAADAVLRAGLPLTLVPLDVTRRVRADAAWTARLAAAPHPFARTVAALVGAYRRNTGAAGASHPLHDPCVMLHALAPHLFTVETLPLRVRLDGSEDAGATEIDAGGTPVAVATGVEAEAALDLLAERLIAPG